MKKDIYEVNEKIAYIMENDLDFETGELNPEVAEQIAALGLEREDLIDNLALTVKNNLILKDGIDAEIKRLLSRKRMLDNSTNFLTNVVRQNITEGEKIKTAQYEIKWTSSTKLYYDDILADPKEFAGGEFDHLIREKTIYEWDKRVITDLIKGNEKAKTQKDVVAIPDTFELQRTKNLKIK